MKPTVGRIVHYHLRAQDLVGDDGKPHAGNQHAVGEIVPLIIVRVWPDEYGAGVPGVNGQAFLDGHAQLWVTSSREGTEPGTWAWPERG